MTSPQVVKTSVTIINSPIQDHDHLPWVAETFHARFQVSVKSSSLVSSACGRHPAKAPRRAREKTSGTQGNDHPEDHTTPTYEMTPGFKPFTTTT